MLFLGLLLASLVGLATAVVLLVRGLRAAFRRNQHWLRTAALLAGAGAVAVYAWGLLHVTLAVLEAEDGGTGSSPIQPCREAGPSMAGQVIGYGVSYLPLHFQCHLTGGGTYATSTVPGYVNPATAVLGVTAVACGTLASTTASRVRAGPV